jgi:hypothetical protein
LNSPHSFLRRTAIFLWRSQIDIDDGNLHLSNVPLEERDKLLPTNTIQLLRSFSNNLGKLFGINFSNKFPFHMLELNKIQLNQKILTIRDTNDGKLFIKNIKDITVELLNAIAAVEGNHKKSILEIETICKELYHKDDIVWNNTSLLRDTIKKLNPDEAPEYSTRSAIMTQLSNLFRHLFAQLHDTFLGVPMRDQIFVCYSRKNTSWLEEKLLPALRGRIGDNSRIWYDKVGIEGSDIWRQKIDLALQRAKIAVLLVSAEFFDSPFIMNHELPYILKHHASGEIYIFWIPIGHSRVDSHELNNIQCVVDPQIPLVSKNEAEIQAAFKKLADVIYKVL